MTTRLVTVLLAALLGLAAGSRVLAADTKWTPAQQEIVAVFDEWAAAEIAADPERLMRLVTADFLGGELPSSVPLGRAGVQRLFEGAIAECMIEACAMPPTSILIEGDTAAACGRYAETRRGNTGARFARSGQWAATLIRRGQQWHILSLFWLEAPPATDEATIKAEVGAALDTFKTAVERVDLAATLATAAEVPEFRYTADDGTVMGFAGWRQGHLEYFPTVTAHRFFPKSQDIAVLGPDAALVSWTGAMEITPKSGAVLRIDPFSASFVFKRVDGAWKLVAQHESCPPAKAVDPAASAEAQLRAADAELVAAANARDLERWLACFEDEVRLFPPDSPPITGKTTIRPAATDLMKSPAFAVVHRIDSVEVSPCGTLAWVDYAFELTTSGPDGQPATETGRDTTLYRRGHDGGWRVVSDIWRPHAPATGD